MKKVLIILIVLLSLGWTLVVTRAQDALTQTYSADDGSFSFMYPAGWQLTGSGNKITIQTDNDQVVAVFFEYLPVSGSLNDAIMQALNDNLGQGGASTTPSFIDTQVGGYPAVQFEVNTSGIVLAGDALDAGNGQAFVGIVYGTSSAMSTFGPTLEAVMASFKPGAASSAPAAAATEMNAAPAEATATPTIETKTFTPADGSYTLTSPADWPWIDDAVSGPGAASMFYGGDFVLSGSISVLPNLTHQSLEEVVKASYEGSLPASALTFTSVDLSEQDVTRVDITGLSAGPTYAVALPDRVIKIALIGDPAVFDAQNAAILATVASVMPSDKADESAAAFAAEYAALASEMAAATAKPTAETQADTKLVTATAGKYTVSVRLPTTLGVSVRDFSRDRVDLSMTGISIVGFDVDVQFPPSVSGGTTARTMLESKLSYADGPITEFQVDGREAARLDNTPDGNSEYVYMIVKTAAGDYVDVEFTVLVDKKEAVEPAMLALLASVMTGDPNAQPAVQPTTESPAAPTAASASAAVACTVTASSTVNLRGGPGTSFAKAGTLSAGASQAVTGQATGADGMVWYQLDSGNYVRSDLVKADGACASLPTVSP